jgi:hypothetical protein
VPDHGRASSLRPGDGTGEERAFEARARAVTAYLRERGIAPERIVTVEGRGEEQPVADNATAEGRALNRRVEVNILPPTGGNTP